SLNDDRDGLISGCASLNTEIKLIEGKLEASRLTLGQRRLLFKAQVPKVALFQSVRRSYSALKPRTPAKIAIDMDKRASDARDEHKELEHDIRSALGRYALNFPDALEGYAQVSISTTVNSWVTEGIATLEGNELIRYREQADEAAGR